MVEVWGARSFSCYETELDIYSVRRALVYSRFPYRLVLANAKTGVQTPFFIFTPVSTRSFF